MFRDLELLGLSDVLIGSNSEFSALAQSLSSPETITLCPPRRPGRDNIGLPCDQTGVPRSVLTHPSKWGNRAVASVDLTEVGPTKCLKGTFIMGAVETRFDPKLNLQCWV